MRAGRLYYVNCDAKYKEQCTKKLFLCREMNRTASHELGRQRREKVTKVPARLLGQAISASVSIFAEWDSLSESHISWDFWNTIFSHFKEQ